MLLGREAECEAVDRLLAGAREGRSGVLVVRGEAGIGKTALCEYAVERAQDMTVLRARGVESESELPFAGLADLLRPALHALAAIPEAQQEAIAGALAIGPPVTGDRFRVCAATLSLLAAAAEEQRVLAVVDDAQWLDTSSAEALLFAGRRLEAEGVVLLFAVRDDELPALERAGLPELRLGGIDRVAAEKLLTDRPGRPIAPEVTERLFAATRGNPLALREIPAVLTEAQLLGQEPLDEPLPLAPTVERAFSTRVAELPRETQRALLVAAATGSGEIEVVARALTSLRVDASALEVLETRGFVRIEGERVEFRHPLLRSAVYYGAPAAARRAVHEALAEAAAGKESIDSSAWHLAAATPDLDEDVARALEEEALGARRRAAYAAAASAFERAARLTSGGDGRSRRLLQAADDSRLAGESARAAELLEEALSSAHDPGLRADIQHLRGAVETWRGAGRLAHELLVREAGRIEEADPAKAAMMLVDAAAAPLLDGDTATVLATARQARKVAERTGGAPEILASALLADALILTGDAKTGHPLLMRCQALVAGSELDVPVRAHQLVQFAGAALIWVEEFDAARDLLVRVVDHARARSAPGVLPYALASLADLDFRTGSWAAAYANAFEALRLATEMGETSALPSVLSALARIEAAQGREDECRAHAARALELARTMAVGSARTFAGAALGLLELGLARGEDAVERLEEVERAVAEQGLGEPGVVLWAPDLVEAYVRAGRADDAERVLAAFRAQAEKTERATALAASARCRGLLAAEDFEAAFDEALGWHERRPTPFERARTELALGERLRRARRPSDARGYLRSALERFERLGATPWAERARAELRASGGAARRPEPSAAEQLTAQELQVALVVAEGATNREAAASLFLSPKTIEAHLGRVYRKLGVRSRTELARRLATEGTLVEAA